MTDSPGSVFNPGLVFQGRYRLDEPISNGGMAQVWKGEDLVLQRPVAIKLLHPHLTSDPETVERFRREAISAARLSHPNIVPTFDTGTDQGATYIVLGLVDGHTLAKSLDSHTFSALQTAMLGQQIADALDHAHKNGLIHRDIKPSNVLLVDNDERVMVADFGIAKVIAESIDPSLTVPGITLGTPAYFAPEQLEGGHVGPSIDIFALGILMHEMICGHSVSDVPTQHITSIDNSIPSICPNLPELIAPVITKASQQQPERRYATAGELRDALASVEEKLRESEQPEILSPAPSNANPPTTAVPKVVAAPTPIPKPSRTPRRNMADEAVAQATARRRKVITAVAVIFLIAAAALTGRFLGGLSDDNSSSSTTTTAPLALTSATSFDPFGSDRSENQGQARFAIDADPNTSWSTETYTNRKFGNLKNGVGLKLALPSNTSLASIGVTSPSNDWAAEIYVADQDKNTLADWGQPVTSLTGISAGSSSFQIAGTKGSNILLWITDLGTQNRVTISDIRVLAK